MGEVLKHEKPRSHLAIAPEPRDSRGRKLGNRGNRVSKDIKRAARDLIRQDLVQHGAVRQETRQRVMVMIGASDKTFRRLCGDVRYDVRKAAAEPEGGPELSELAAFRLQPGKDGWSRKTSLTEELVIEIASYPNVELAWQALSNRPGHLLFGTPRTTFYDRWNSVDAVIRTGIRSGEKAARQLEVAVPLSPVEPFTKFAVDEYDVKVDAAGEITFDRPGAEGSATAGNVRGHFLSIVGVDTDLTYAWTLSPTSFTSEQVAALYAEAAIGWERNGVEVYGAADWLVCDNASIFTSKESGTKLAHVGTQADPVRSYTPEANPIERRHRDYTTLLRQLPAHSRRPSTSSGLQHSDGQLSWEELAAAVSAVVDAGNFEHCSSRDGKTAWERYVELVGTSGDRRRDVTDLQIAHMAFGVRPAGGKTTYATHGRKVRFNHAQYFGDKLSDSGVTQVHLRRLLTHTDVLYAFDEDGNFLDVLVNEAFLDAELRDSLRAGQYARNRALLRIMMGAAELREAEGLERVTGIPSAIDGDYSALVAQVQASGLAPLLSALSPELIKQLADVAATKETAATSATAAEEDATDTVATGAPLEPAPALEPATSAPLVSVDAALTREERQAARYDALLAEGETEVSK